MDTVSQISRTKPFLSPQRQQSRLFIATHFRFVTVCRAVYSHPRQAQRNLCRRNFRDIISPRDVSTGMIAISLVLRSWSSGFLWMVSIRFRRKGRVFQFIPKWEKRYRMGCLPLPHLITTFTLLPLRQTTALSLLLSGASFTDALWMVLLNQHAVRLPVSGRTAFTLRLWR